MQTTSVRPAISPAIVETRSASFQQLSTKHKVTVAIAVGSISLVTLCILTKPIFKYCVRKFTPQPAPPPQTPAAAPAPAVQRATTLPAEPVIPYEDHARATKYNISVDLAGRMNRYKKETREEPATFRGCLASGAITQEEYDLYMLHDVVVSGGYSPYDTEYVAIIKKVRDSRPSGQRQGVVNAFRNGDITPEEFDALILRTRPQIKLLPKEARGPAFKYFRENPKASFDACLNWLVANGDISASEKHTIDCRELNHCLTVMNINAREQLPH